MTVVEEIKNAIPRQSEIVKYEQNAKGTIEQCYCRLREWFLTDKLLIVGRGGHHVFVSRKDSGKRILLITE